MTTRPISDSIDFLANVSLSSVMTEALAPLEKPNPFQFSGTLSLFYPATLANFHFAQVFFANPRKSPPTPKEVVQKKLTIATTGFVFGPGLPTPDGLEELKAYAKHVKSGEGEMGGTSGSKPQRTVNVNKVFGPEGIDPSMTTLKAIAKVMKSIQAKDLKFIIEAHTDSHGSAEANKALTQRRAEAIKIFLEILGVPEQALKAVGRGEETLLVPEIGTDEQILAARLKNRRIVIRAVENF